MRVKNLIYGEFGFMFKYGIIFLYCIFTAVYLCLLAAIPASVREVTAAILVFTDPAAMGLFFMGAVVLLEKSQRVESSLCVSPIKVSEYIIAKLIPFMTVGVIVGLILSLFAGVRSITYVLTGVAFSSVLFSMCGLIVGSRIRTLNGFMIATIPFEIFLCLPSILFLFGVLKSKFWLVHPGVVAINLIRGNTNHWYLSVLILAIWIVPAYFACKRTVTKSFLKMGGAKL